MNQLADQPHGLVSVAAAIIGNAFIMVIKFASFFCFRLKRVVFR